MVFMKFRYFAFSCFDKFHLQTVSFLRVKPIIPADDFVGFWCKLFPEPDPFEQHYLSWKSVSQQNLHLEKIGTFQENAWAVQDNSSNK